MEKLKIVVNRNTPFVVDVFSRLGEVIALDTSDVTREAVRNADILIVRSETKVDEKLLKGSRVKFVGTVTIGTDHIDLEYLRSAGIAFASAPGSNANSVAEYLTAALLVWSRRNEEPLRGKSIGVVGVGNVGSKVVRVAGALGMKVLKNDPPLARATGDPSFLPLDALMEVDFVSLHVPLTRTGDDATFHLFDATRIGKMKRGAVLVNTARGAVVDNSALTEALVSNHLSAAILDVWEREPDIDVGLLQRALIGTAHIAGYSLDGKLNALRMVYERVCRHFGFSSAWPVEAKSLVEVPRVFVPEELSEELEILAYSVRQVYDIEYDDALLRKIAEVPRSERGAYFMKLRADYRIRREFFNSTVELLPHQSLAVNALQALGFNTLVREEVKL